MIRLENVTKYYPNSDTPALDELSLHIRKGEFVFVLGSSGAGKTTLLKLLLRETTADSGRVMVNGFNLKKIRQRKIPYLRRSLGVVFQDFRLIPTMTAYENVAFAMRVTNVAESEIRDRVPFVLGLVGLGDKLDRYPDQLSGGEQQRVALARALVHSPQLIIADEPTGNIDPELSVEIMELLAAINSVGVTVVVVTHEHELVKRFHKRIIHIEHGKVVEDTDPPSEDEFEEEIPKGTGLEALARLNNTQNAAAAGEAGAASIGPQQKNAEETPSVKPLPQNGKAEHKERKKRKKQPEKETVQPQKEPVSAETPEQLTSPAPKQADAAARPAAQGEKQAAVLNTETSAETAPKEEPETSKFKKSEPAAKSMQEPHSTTMAEVDALLRQLGGQ